MPRPDRSGRGRAVRFAIVGAATLVAAWFVAATTIGSVFAQSYPAIALAWSPRNAVASGYRAQQLWQENPLRPDARAIEPLARASLASSPSDIPAAAMLGAVADLGHQSALAERIFRNSDRLSRHDLLTQSFLIEAAVRRGDVGGALAHYNAALSTSPANAALLMPTLVAASADPAIARPLAGLLRQRPIWWADFTRRLVETRADPVASFPVLLDALRLAPSNPTERAMMSAALNRLIDAGHGRVAYDLYRKAVPATPSAPALMRNGGFGQASHLPPFDWDIRDDGGVSAYVQPLRGASALFVSAQAPSDVATQRLLLTPGTYVLGARIGSEDDRGVETTLSLGCDGTATPLATLRATAGKTAALLRTAFTVSRNCASQRLSIAVNPVDQTGGQSWITDITVAAQGMTRPQGAAAR